MAPQYLGALFAVQLMLSCMSSNLLMGGARAQPETSLPDLIEAVHDANKKLSKSFIAGGTDGRVQFEIDATTTEFLVRPTVAQGGFSLDLTQKPYTTSSWATLRRDLATTYHHLTSTEATVMIEKCLKNVDVLHKRMLEQAVMLSRPEGAQHTEVQKGIICSALQVILSKNHYRALMTDQNALPIIPAPLMYELYFVLSKRDTPQSVVAAVRQMYVKLFYSMLFFWNDYAEKREYQSFITEQLRTQLKLFYTHHGIPESIVNDGHIAMLLDKVRFKQSVKEQQLVIGSIVSVMLITTFVVTRKYKLGERLMRTFAKLKVRQRA